MTLEQAIAEVTLNAQTDAFPNLSPEQVSDLVQKNRRATVWTAEFQYKIGDIVQPTVPNGHFYRRLINGLSPGREPVWAGRIESKVYEEGQIVWVECGWDADGNLYNTRNATHAAWLLKAAVAAKEFDVSIDQQKWTRSQIYEHCLEMARAWSPFD